MPTLQLPDGRKLSYREEGSGPPLVLVHGSPGDGRSWARVAPYLKDDFGDLPDLPGYGGSDGCRRPPDGWRWARLCAPGRSCGAGASGGHSFGGNIALQAVLQARPDAVERVVLFEPVYFRALELVGDRAALEPAAAYFEDYARRATEGEPGVVRLMIDFWFGEDAWGRIPEQVRGYLNAAAAANALDVRSTFRDTNEVAALAAFRRPVTIIDGETSPEIVRAIARAMLKLLPEAKREALAGANHGMLDSHPEAVARLIAT